MADVSTAQEQTPRFGDLRQSRRHGGSVACLVAKFEKSTDKRPKARQQHNVVLAEIEKRDPQLCARVRAHLMYRRELQQMSKTLEERQSKIAPDDDFNKRRMENRMAHLEFLVNSADRRWQELGEAAEALLNETYMAAWRQLERDLF